MSKYTDFVKAHIGSAKGATQKDKFRYVAALWRKQKGRGLTAPGMHAGKGTSRVSGLHDTARDWSDYGDKPALNGEGIKRRYRKKGGSIYTPHEELNRRSEEQMDKAAESRVGRKKAKEHEKLCAESARMKQLSAKLMASRADRGGKVAAMRMKRGGCYGEGLSGLVSKKQAAALAKHIKQGGRIDNKFLKFLEWLIPQSWLDAIWNESMFSQ